MTLASKLRDYRISNGLTQAELGEQLGGVGQGQVSKWEKGKETPRPANLKRIAALFGESPQALLDSATPDPFSGHSLEQTEAPGSEQVACRHPAWGALKGTFTILPGVDLTEPSYDDWKALYGEEN